MCCGSYPNYKGYSIAELEEGDEVILHIPGKTDVTTYIWQIDGFSALTASGHILSCQSEIEFEATGNHADDFEVSDEALQIQGQITARQTLDIWGDLDDEPDPDPLDLL